MIPRLFIEADLAPGQEVELEAAPAHYLRNVMRLGPGAAIKLFNGRDGEWSAELTQVDRRLCIARPTELSRSQVTEPDIWLCFAPIKRARIDFLVEKASELGVSRLQPVLTEHTIVERVNVERLRATAIEAAEQSERLTVPVVSIAVDLASLIAHWPPERRLLLCDETGGGAPILDALSNGAASDPGGSWALLIGPEGGFSRRELDRLAAVPQLLRVGLGPRILRADTAALAALAVWQARIGDWRRPTPPRWPDYASSR